MGRYGGRARVDDEDIYGDSYASGENVEPAGCAHHLMLLGVVIGGIWLYESWDDLSLRKLGRSKNSLPDDNDKSADQDTKKRFSYFYWLTLLCDFPDVSAIISSCSASASGSRHTS